MKRLLTAVALVSVFFLAQTVMAADPPAGKITFEHTPKGSKGASHYDHQANDGHKATACTVCHASDAGGALKWAKAKDDSAEEIKRVKDAAHAACWTCHGKKNEAGEKIASKSCAKCHAKAAE